MIGKKKLGLVLGSGVGHTIADVGAIKALQEAGVEADLVAGSSGGSMVGAFYAAGYGYQQMEEIARGLKWRKFFRLAKPDRGILSSRSLEEHLDKELAGRRFKDLKHPLSVVASDLVSGKEVILDAPDMKVSRAVAASCAVPMVFQPVEHEGILVDGAVFNKLPVKIVKEKGAKVVVAIGPARGGISDGDDLSNVFQLANRLISLIGIEKTLASERLADLVIHVDTAGVSPWDLEGSLGLIEQAEAQMRARLPELTKRLGGNLWQRLMWWKKS